MFVVTVGSNYAVGCQVKQMAALERSNCLRDSLADGVSMFEAPGRDLAIGHFTLVS